MLFATFGVALILSLRSAVLRRGRFDALFPSHSRKLSGISEAFFLFFQGFQVFQRVAVIIIIAIRLVMSIRVNIAFALVTHVVGAIHVHIQVSELLASDIAPVTTGVFARAAAAACEILHAVHSKSSASVAGWYDTRATRNRVHVCLTQRPEGLTRLQGWWQRPGKVVFCRVVRWRNG